MFYFRLARAGPRSEPTVYEVVRIDGCFRRADSAPRGRPIAGPTGLQLIRRARGRDDNIPLHSVSGNDIVSFITGISNVIDVNRPPFHLRCSLPWLVLSSRHCSVIVSSKPVDMSTKPVISSMVVSFSVINGYR